MRYHNTPNGPRVCHAEKGRCPYGAQGYPHFDTRAEAETAYEKSLAQSFGSFDTLKKTTSEKMRQGAYEGADRMLATARKVVASEPVRRTVNAINTVKSTPQRARQGVAMARQKFRNAIATKQAQASALMRNMKTRALGSVESFKQDYRDAVADRDAYHAQLDAQRAARSAARRAQVHETVQAASTMARVSGNRVLDHKFTRQRSAARLRIGDRLPGNTVMGVMQNGNNVDVTMMSSPSGMIRKVTMPMNRSVTTEWTMRSRVVDPIRRSPFFQRVKQAGELQKQSFQVLFNANAGRSQVASPFETRARGTAAASRHASSPFANSNPFATSASSSSPFTVPVPPPPVPAPDGGTVPTPEPVGAYDPWRVQPGSF